MVRAGPMRYLISVQQRSQVLDAFGAPQDSWVEVFACRASIDWTPGREVFAAASRNARVPTVFRIRYRGGVVPSMRIVYETRTFDIISAVDQDGRREQLTLTAEELVSEVAGEVVGGVPYVPASLYIRADHTSLEPIDGLAAGDVQEALEELTARPSGGAEAPLILTGADAAQPVLVVGAALAQTAAIQQWKDSTGAVLAELDATVNLVPGADQTGRIGTFQKHFLEAYFLRVYSSNIYSKGGGNTLFLNSQRNDSATSIGTVINTLPSYVTSGAKLLSVQNASAEKLYVDKDGAVWAAGIVTANGLFKQAAGAVAPMHVRGGSTDNAAAVGVYLDNMFTLATAGAKLVSVRNNGAEQAFFDKDGALTILGTASTYALTLPSGKPLRWGTGTAITLTGNEGNGALYASHSIMPAGTDTTDLGGSGNRWRRLYLSSGVMDAGGFSRLSIPINGTTTYPSRATDGATAVGHKFTRVGGALTTAGAKIAAFYPDDNVTEVANIDKDGNYEVMKNGGGIILRSPNGTRYKLTVSDAGALTTTAL